MWPSAAMSRTPPSQPRRRSAEQRVDGVDRSRSAGDAAASTTWRSIGQCPRGRAQPRALRGRHRRASFSIRIAVALNSAVPDFGSVASMVSRLVGDVVLEVEGHEREARPERRVEPDRRLDRAAPRHDPDALALGEPSALGVLGRDVERLAAPQRRGVAAGLDAGVVRVEPAAGGQPDRVTRRRACRPAGRARPARTARGCPATGLLPQPRVEEQLAGVRLVVARPLEAALAPPAARSTCRRGRATASGARSRRPRRSASPSRGPCGGRARR